MRSGHARPQPAPGGGAGLTRRALPSGKRAVETRTPNNPARSTPPAKEGPGMRAAPQNAPRKKCMGARHCGPPPARNPPAQPTSPAPATGQPLVQEDAAEARAAPTPTLHAGSHTHGTSNTTPTIFAADVVIFIFLLLVHSGNGRSAGSGTSQHRVACGGRKRALTSTPYFREMAGGCMQRRACCASPPAGCTCGACDWASSWCGYFCQCPCPLEGRAFSGMCGGRAVLGV